MLDGPFSKLLARYGKFADELYSVATEVSVIQGEFRNLWIQGPAGCGKSRWVWDNFEHELYPKAISKWWDYYKNERIVLIEDWDPTHKMLA